MAKHESVVIGTFGQTIQGETRIELTEYDTVYLRFRKPDGTWVEKQGQKRAGDNGDSRVEYDPAEVDAIFAVLGQVKVHSKAVSGGVSIVSKKAAIIEVVAEGQM